MSNPLSDFPADVFQIFAFCDCGHRTALDLSALPETMTVDRLRARLRCRECGSREVSVRIIWHGGIGYKHEWGGAVERRL